MSGAASLGKRDQKTLQARAKAILKARPAYKEMVDFYLTVFGRQMEWRERLVIQPQAVSADQRRDCLRLGRPLVERFDAGIDAGSLLALWGEMKAVFRRGNQVLRQAVDRIEEAEKSGRFTPIAWLPEQRPDREELVTDAARQIGVDEGVLATLARAVTFPHWEQVVRSWLPQEDRLDEWKRFHCPTCGGPPGLVELRADPGGSEGIRPARRRFMHCPFCGSRWVVAALTCPACGSTKDGDAKYLFTADEPELRIDFCKECQQYIKVVDGDKMSGPVHVGLELLTTAHLDVLAQDKNLSPLNVCA